MLPLRYLSRNVICSSFGWNAPLDILSGAELVKCEQTLRVTIYVIPRCFVIGFNGPALRTRLHVFCDGSTVAYGASAYVRIEDQFGTLVCSLAISRNKLTPQRKVLTIPKIKLSACANGIRVAQSILRESTLSFHSNSNWTDCRCSPSVIRNETDCVRRPSPGGNQCQQCCRPMEVRRHRI